MAGFDGVGPANVLRRRCVASAFAAFAALPNQICRAAGQRRGSPSPSDAPGRQRVPVTDSRDCRPQAGILAKMSVSTS